METMDFKLADVKDTDNKLSRLAEYQQIKRDFFELAPAILKGEYSIRKFHTEKVIPRIPDGVPMITYQEVFKWYKRIKPDMMRYATMVEIQSSVKREKTLLEREHEKLVAQAEIRQDVTELMRSYIQRLRLFIEDPDIAKQLTHKEMLELYKIIREEEDRAKGLSLKERAEDRADASFAWMVSQAKSGQLDAEDISMLEDDIKNDLLIFKQENGIYQLPTGIIPTIRSATEAPAS